MWPKKKKVSLYPCRRNDWTNQERGGRAQEEHTWVVKQVCLSLSQTHSTSAGQHSVVVCPLDWKADEDQETSEASWRWDFMWICHKKQQAVTTYSSLEADLCLSGQDWCVGLEYIWDFLLFTCFCFICLGLPASLHVCHLLWAPGRVSSCLRNIKLVALFLFVWPTSLHSSLVCNNHQAAALMIHIKALAVLHWFNVFVVFL